MPSLKAICSALALSSVLLAIGCASRPDLRLDQDPSADLRSYKTFAFFEQPTADGARYSSLLGSRLRQATRTQLERQGYVYREASADLRVNLALRVVQKQELQGLRGGYRGWAGHAELNDFREGTLVVDLVDTQRNALVWQGVLVGRITEQAMKDSGPAIEKAVAEVFADFPGSAARRAAG